MALTCTLSDVIIQHNSIVLWDITRGKVQEYHRCNNHLTFDPTISIRIPNGLNTTAFMRYEKPATQEVARHYVGWTWLAKSSPVVVIVVTILKQDVSSAHFEEVNPDRWSIARGRTNDHSSIIIDPNLQTEASFSVSSMWIMNNRAATASLPLKRPSPKMLDGTRD